MHRGYHRNHRRSSGLLRTPLAGAAALGRGQAQGAYSLNAAPPYATLANASPTVTPSAVKRKAERSMVRPLSVPARALAASEARTESRFVLRALAGTRRARAR